METSDPVRCHGCAALIATERNKRVPSSSSSITSLFACCSWLGHPAPSPSKRRIWPPSEWVYSKLFFAATVFRHIGEPSGCPCKGAAAHASEGTRVAALSPRLGHLPSPRYGCSAVSWVRGSKGKRSLKGPVLSPFSARPYAPTASSAVGSGRLPQQAAPAGFQSGLFIPSQGTSPKPMDFGVCKEPPSFPLVWEQLLHIASAILPLTHRCLLLWNYGIRRNRLRKNNRFSYSFNKVLNRFNKI